MGMRKPHRLQRATEQLDKVPGTAPIVARLHTKAYTNFLVEHGRMVGERKTIIKFVQVRCEPALFLELLKRAFEGRHMPKIALDEGFILPGYERMGVQDAFSVVWEGDLSDGMLGWINSKVRQLDEQLGRR